MATKKKKINFRYNLKTYLEFLKKYKGLFIFLLFITLIMEFLYVADKFLFKRIIDDAEPFLAGNLSPETFLATLGIIAVIFLSILITRSILKWVSIHLLSKLDSKLIIDVKRKYFNHIVGLSHNFHATHKTGSLISRMNRGAGAIESMSDMVLFNFTPLIFQLIIVGTSLMFFSVVSAITILVITVAFVSYSLLIQTIQQKTKIEYNRTEDMEKALISDVFTNIDSIKYYGKEGVIKNKFKKAAEKTKWASLRHWGYFRWFDAGHIFIIGVGTFFLLYYPITQLLAGEITLGTLVFIYTVYGNVLGPMFGFVWGMRGFYRAMADFQDLFEYGKVENDIKDKPNAPKLKIKEGVIEFKNVNFNYGKRKIFENFNLKINKNEKIALVGHSGCGKTTLIKVLYRLYELNGGEILIDGKNISEYKQESLRSEMGIVPQECILFDDTIYNNIKFANPQASRKQVMSAIKFAQLDKIMEEFPKKERTVVGERGVKLSGGEKQRVSIARAILSNKKVLVLDEATSALDSETENEIQRDLENLLEGRTTIIVAHRLSTIMKADKILVMKRGKIEQIGKHEELINQPGEYKKLWKLQKGGYIK